MNVISRVYHYIHSLNEWSGHTPLSFSIRCKNWSKNTRDYESVKHKWNASYWDAFRTVLLTKAGLLDNLPSSIDTNSVQSVNEVVNSCNTILREVADRLFEKHIVCSNTVSFSPSSCVNYAEWFDSYLFIYPPLLKSTHTTYRTKCKQATNCTKYWKENQT